MQELRRDSTVEAKRPKIPGSREHLLPLEALQGPASSVFAAPCGSGTPDVAIIVDFWSRAVSEMWDTTKRVFQNNILPAEQIMPCTCAARSPGLYLLLCSNLKAAQSRRAVSCQAQGYSPCLLPWPSAALSGRCQLLRGYTLFHVFSRCGTKQIPQHCLVECSLAHPS